MPDVAEPPAEVRIVEAPAWAMSVKGRDTQPALPDSVVETRECVVQMVVDRDGKPLRVEPGDCPPELAEPAQALLGWAWWEPRIEGGFDEVRFPFRVIFETETRFPRQYTDDWGMNVAWATHRYRPDGADSCVVTGTLHRDGAWTDLTSNSPTGCRLITAKDTVRLTTKSLRLAKDGATCTAKFDAKGPEIVVHEVTGCPEEVAAELGAKIPRFIWSSGSFELRVAVDSRLAGGTPAPR